MNELSSHNTGAGKGDGDRSPGWRDHYDEINWQGSQGFERIGPGRLRKRYGTRTGTGVSLENWDTGKIDCFTDVNVPVAEGVRIYEALTNPDGTVTQDGPVADALPSVPEDKHGATCRCCCRGSAKHD